MRDAAEAAATLVRQVEAHKALTAGSGAPHEIAAAPQPTATSDETGDLSRKRRRSKKKKTVSESAPPAT
jgi:hypothetical protein